MITKETVKPNLPSIDQQFIEMRKALVTQLEDINKYIKKAYPNWFKAYTLTAQSNYVKIPFENDTGNTPISNIQIITTGGGLYLSLNTGEAFSVSMGDIYQGDLSRIEYLVTGAGPAIVLLMARIDK